jgi:Kef-type K+ transport system membrane component KefB
VPSLSEKQILSFLTQFILLVLTARLLADLMRRAGQATVIGELMAGVVLGPSILGKCLPGIERRIFPPEPIVNHLVEASAWIGVIMLLLCTGLETDLNTLRNVRRPAALVSSLGIVVPFAGGFLLGWYLPVVYLAAPNQRLIFALFLAVAMSISAVPVIAKILIDLDLMQRELGLLILAAGILDDSVGWLLLSVVAGLAARGVVDLLHYRAPLSRPQPSWPPAISSAFAWSRSCCDGLMTLPTSIMRR